MTRIWKISTIIFIGSVAIKLNDVLDLRKRDLRKNMRINVAAITYFLGNFFSDKKFNIKFI